MLAPTKPIKSCECGSPCGGCCGCTKESIGLGNVDNTSDLNKPLSRDMINALSGKVGIDIFTQLKNRVLALENTITDIPDLKFRVRQCELDITENYEDITKLQNTTKSMADTITELGNRVTGVNDSLVTVGTRVDALEAKDSNNVKLSGVNVQTIQGTLKANDPASGATDKTLVTANWISQTGNSSPNNLIHKTGNEIKYGKLTLREILTLYNENWDTAPYMVSKINLDSTVAPTKFLTINGGFVIRDVNNRDIWKIRAYRDTNGRDVLSIDGLAYDNSSGYFHFEIGPNNYRKITTNFDKPSNW